MSLLLACTINFCLHTSKSVVFHMLSLPVKMLITNVTWDAMDLEARVRWKFDGESTLYFLLTSSVNSV